MPELSPELKCRACHRETMREIRCQHCGKCPVCADHGFLRGSDGVEPCYNCNPDGMGNDD